MNIKEWFGGKVRKPAVTEITADFDNGDILVLSVDWHLTFDQRKHMGTYVNDIAYGKVRAVVLERGMTLSVIRKPSTN